jgi:hypothetical protein
MEDEMLNQVQHDSRENLGSGTFFSETLLLPPPPFLTLHYQPA